MPQSLGQQTGKFTMQNTSDRSISDDNPASPHLIVLWLAIMFFAVAMALIVFQTSAQIDPVWTLLAIPFNFGMTGALVLFHFLSSSANIDRQAYRVGGAIAGFLVLFTLFYNLSKGPYLEENQIIKLSKNPLVKRFWPIADRYNDITALKNDTLVKIAESSLQKLRSTFDRLAQGTYLINADELPTYVLPMIKNCKHTFFATQYVFPDKFWRQYWAQEYFDENVRAVKERHVELIRISANCKTLAV